MGDYWTADLTRLNGQPKKTIGDYVASKGIPVPERLESFEHAKEVGGFGRSEHVLEYAREHYGKLVPGISGLFNSEIVPKDVTEDEFLRTLTLDDFNKEEKKLHYMVEGFCEWTNTNPEDLISGLSASYWKYIQGNRGSIVADGVVPNRYHIKCKGERLSSDFYVAVENGNVIHSSYREHDMNIIDSMIELYEATRSLPKFQKNGCPVIEVVFNQGEAFFAQYHRTRIFDEVDPFLQGRNFPGYNKAKWTRGATPKEGLELEFIAVEGWLWDRSHPQLPVQDQAGTDTMDFAYNELISPVRTAFITDATDLKLHLSKLVEGHVNMSTMFKPQVAIIVDPELFPETSTEEIEKIKDTGIAHTLKVHIISDGRDAYFRVI